jgi:cytochrome P450
MSAAASSELYERIRAFDLYDPSLQSEPLFDFFNEIRESVPLARTEAAGGIWIVSRHTDALFVLQHPEIFSSRSPMFPYVSESTSIPVSTSIPFTMDPPDHGKYRHLLAPMFAPVRAAEMEPLIRQTARELAEKAGSAAVCDFIEDFGRPVPSRVFLDSFDIPAERLPEMTEIAEASNSMPEDEDGMRRQAQARKELDEYFADLVAERRGSGGAGRDVISWLIRSEVDGRPLTDQEIVNILGLLMEASLDTTTSALANMVAYLATHPAQRDRLVAEPRLIPGCVEELLRFEPMVFQGRVVTQRVEIHGTTLEPGDRVMVLFAAANHDPRAFSNPDSIDFERHDNRHLTFGAGPHRCLGLHLARATLRIALEEWHRAVPIYSVEPGTEVKRRLTVVSAVTSLRLLTRR